MNFPKLIKPKMKVYLGLLIAVIVLMIVLSRYSRPSVGTPGSGGDTIDVALEYSPLSFYTYGDTLGGYNYDLLRLISKQQGNTRNSRIQKQVPILQSCIYRQSSACATQR